MFDYHTLRSIFFKLDPEMAHNIAQCAMRGTNIIFPGLFSFVASRCVISDVSLQQSLLNSIYNNPVSLGGGFDKNATMLPALSALGFGSLEFGTFTPKAQNGNDKPRLFRLVDEESIQNAMGFNNQGCEVIKKRVSKIYPFTIPLWANIGKNKATLNENAIKDYEILVREFNGLCDAFVINLSSPNTPNLRDLLDEGFISELFNAIKSLSDTPILLKISPDMSDEKAVKICKIAVKNGASGVIVNNTSVDYSLSKSPNLKSFGGLSGQVIKQRSREIFKAVASELFGECVLVSCGGIDSGDEAYERIKMGANLVQIFTSFIYKGPMIVRDINSKILELLKRDGYENISQAVGANLKGNG